MDSLAGRGCCCCCCCCCRILPGSSPCLLPGVQHDTRAINRDSRTLFLRGLIGSESPTRGCDVDDEELRTVFFNGGGSGGRSSEFFESSGCFVVTGGCFVFFVNFGESDRFADEEVRIGTDSGPSNPRLTFLSSFVTSMTFSTFGLSFREGVDMWFVPLPQG